MKITLALLLLGATACFAGNLRIPLPKSSKPTPVQKLNQEGVQALGKHDYAKAKKLFYKAYLIDPDDPFTLNNLGYISELDGDLDSAQRFYALAAEHPSEAVVVKATDQGAIGKPVDKVAGNAADEHMQVNRMNVQAMGLVEKDRAPEADLILQKALALDPRNPFTLNNLAYAKEKEGELEQAIKLYSRAAATGSEERIVVAMNKKWRGEGISSVAAENARKAEDAFRRERQGGADVKVARLNLRGVSAENRNERKLARQFFAEAYKLDPSDAFTLNNMGYVAELDGDRETAEYFYAKAQDARKAKSRVASATRKEMEGESLALVATTGDQAVDSAQKTALEIRRREAKTPPALLRRDNTPVIEPSQPPPPMEGPARPSGPRAGNTATPPPPRATAVENGAVQDVMPPLPDSEQPATSSPSAPTKAPGTGIENGPVQDVMPPLPDSEQPK
ncbi:MAG: tetratricopeptide repeat protein [Candidatus Korobacteraceae bacterium]